MSTTTDVRPGASATTTSTGPAAAYNDAASQSTHPSRGRVLERRGGVVVFQPKGTNYELHLVADGYDGPLDKPVEGIIKVVSRKVYTVPSGGNFIAPILGTPRIIQGRVLAADGRQLVVQAGGIVTVDLPADAHAIDLGNGPITVGSIVNITVLPGARFERVG